MTMNILADHLDFPEGPLFDVQGRLWAVEMKAGNLLRLEASGLRRFGVGGAPNGLAMDQAGGIFFTDSARNEIRRFDPDTEESRQRRSPLRSGLFYRKSQRGFPRREDHS